MTQTIVFKKSVDAAKDYRIALIKKEAAERISALDWKVTRAKERFEMTGDNTELISVYNERESIRQSSNKAEEDVMSLTDYDEIMSFIW